MTISTTLFYQRPRRPWAVTERHNILWQNKGNAAASCDAAAQKWMEARGVEPLSENPRTQASPSAVCVLTFPPAYPRRQGYAFSSFIRSRRWQSLQRLVPCLNDAGDPRRRKPGADVRGLGRESYVIVVVSSFKFPLSGGSGPPLASLSLRIPVETKYGPANVLQTGHPRARMARSMSRLASRLARSSRLS